MQVPEPYTGMMVTQSVRLERPLGEGGMGAVWVADHLALHTKVVVKFIAHDLVESKEALERFSREAAAAAQVKSPHVVQTFDHGITEWGVPYIVMELLEGSDLGEHIAASGALEPAVTLALIEQLCRALERAHERGIVHRDIKPSNVFLCDAGGGEFFVKLLDFGIAKGVDVPQVDSETKTGTMMGSPFYMSPEQIVGAKDIDHRTDLWSVGIVAYEALTGRKPFEADTLGGLAIRIHTGDLPLPSEQREGLPRAVDAWFARACARRAEDRFGSARALSDALAMALRGEAIEPPRLVTHPPPHPQSARSRFAADPTVRALASTDAGSVTTAPVAPATAKKGRVALALGALAAVAVLALAGLAAPRILGGSGATPMGTGPVASPVPTSPTAAEPTVLTALPEPSGALSGAASAASATPSAAAEAATTGGPRRGTHKHGHGGGAGASGAAPQASAPASAKPRGGGDDIF